MHTAMKTTLLHAVAAVVIAATATSCYTTYDAYGRPVQSVDPGAATAAALAAGAIGYSIGHHHDHDYYYRPYYYGHTHRHYGYYRYYR